MWSLWFVASAWALDLQEARDRAVANALAVERAEAAAQVARGEATSAVEQALPSVSAFADASTGAGQTAFGFQRPIATQIGLGGRFAWTAVDPSTWARATEARRESAAQRAMADWARVDARAAATTAYGAAWGARAEVEALERLVEQSERTRAVVTDKADVGLVRRVDASRAAAEAATARARLADARGREARTCASLQALVGDPVDGRCALAPVTWEQPATTAVEHPALVAFQAVVDASAAGRRASAWALGPVLGVEGTVAHYIVPGVSEGLGWNVGGGLTVPIVSGAGTWGGLAVAKGRVRDAEAALEEQRRALQVAQVGAARRHDAAVSAFAARQEALAAAEEALRGAEEEYGVGRASITDLLAVRATWAEALVGLAAAEAEVGAALAELEAARGVF